MVNLLKNISIPEVIFQSNSTFRFEYKGLNANGCSVLPRIFSGGEGQAVGQEGGRINVYSM